jgi:hypothetical protein
MRFFGLLLLVSLRGLSGGAGKKRESKELSEVRAEALSPIGAPNEGFCELPAALGLSGTSSGGAVDRGYARLGRRSDPNVPAGPSRPSERRLVACAGSEGRLPLSAELAGGLTRRIDNRFAELLLLVVAAVGEEASKGEGSQSRGAAALELTLARATVDATSLDEVRDNDGLECKISADARGEPGFDALSARGNVANGS